MPPKKEAARRHRRKRQRKSRTEDFSDSSSSDSETRDQVKEQEKEGRGDEESEEDETMADAGSSSDSEDDNEVNAKDEDSAASVLMPNAGTMMNLLPELEKANEDDIKNYYRSFVTREFGEELKKIEEDVNDEAEYLRILGEAVTAGLNVFDEKEKIQLTRPNKMERNQH